MGKFKRVLIYAPLLPEYDRESGSRRTYDLIDFLRKEDWAVTFVSQHDTGGERYIKVLQQQGVATYTGYESLIDLLLTADFFDLIIFAFWHTAEAHLPAVRAISPTTRVIVDSIDLHYLRNARRAFRKSEGGASIGLDTNYASEMKRELNTYAAADAVWTVSQKEADLVNDLVGDPTLACAVPDSEHLVPSNLPFKERKGIVFIGNFRHEPNVDAVEYLCKDIVPQLDPSILAEHPVYIVGNALDECGVSFDSQADHVHMVGWVPSVLPYLERARVSIIPLRYGAGTKRKLIQALMMGTPTVSTNIGIEGLNLRDGEHTLVANDPTGFAESIARLLTDPELWQRLAGQGQAHIVPLHSREATQACLTQGVSSVLAKEAKSVTLTASLLEHNGENSHYQQLIQRIRKIASDALRPGSRVLVVSKGDGELLQFGGWPGWHFPQEAAGSTEQHFAEGPQGTVSAPWIGLDTTYEFRLYSGTEPKTLLAAIRVSRSDNALLTRTLNPVTPSDKVFLTATLTASSEQPDWGAIIDWGAPIGWGTPMISWRTEDDAGAQVYVSEDSEYAGHHPADGAEAIAHLEELRERGAEYLLFPATAFWWFEHYPEFGRHLEGRYRVVAHEEDTCLIFSLGEPPAAGDPRVPETSVRDARDALAVAVGGSPGNRDLASGRKSLDGLRPVVCQTITTETDHESSEQGNKILVLGIYLANKQNNIEDIVLALSQSKRYEVTQRWIALGGEPPTTRVAGVTVDAFSKRKPKYQILNELLAAEDLSQYEYVLFSDDDIVLPHHFIDQFVGMQAGLDYAVAQPARSSNSYIDHPIVEQQRGALARRTLFVEIGPVISFHKSVYHLVFPFDLTCPMGWGYECVWAYVMTQHEARMGIIDNVPVDHSLRAPVAFYNWEKADRERNEFLSRHKHLPYEHCYRVLDVIADREDYYEYSTKVAADKRYSSDLQPRGLTKALPREPS